MGLDTDLQTKLSALVGTAVPVQQNYSSRDKAQPRVWYQRQAGNTDLFMQGTPALTTTSYAVEVGGLDPDVTAAVALAITSVLHGFRGTMGGSLVLGCFAQDAADDYQPRNLALDDGYHVIAFTLEFMTG